MASLPIAQVSNVRIGSHRTKPLELDLGVPQHLPLLLIARPVEPACRRCDGREPRVPPGQHIRPWPPNRIIGCGLDRGAKEDNCGRIGCGRAVPRKTNDRQARTSADARQGAEFRTHRRGLRRYPADDVDQHQATRGNPRRHAGSARLALPRLYPRGRACARLGAPRIVGDSRAMRQEIKSLKDKLSGEIRICGNPDRPWHIGIAI